MSSVEIVMLVVIILASVGFGYFSVKRFAAQREKSMREQFPDAKAIFADVNFFGQESRGAAQMRGNGTMVITDSEIYFELWLPRKAFTIPLNRIQSIETPKSFLGKSIGRSLLQVMYLDESGRSDSMAWYVEDLSSAKALLDRRRM